MKFLISCLKKKLVEINGEKIQVAKYVDRYTTDNDSIGNFFFEVDKEWLQDQCF